MADEIKFTTSQLYRNLFLRLWKLLAKPANEWSIIKSEDKSFNGILSDFALPLIGLVTLATFVGLIFNQQGFNAEMFLKHATVEFVRFFGGLYLAFFLVGVVLSISGLKRREVLALTAYSSGLWYVISFVIALIPELVPIYLLAIYNAYIAYKGVLNYISTATHWYQISISALLFVSVHLFPYLIKLILLKFIMF